MKVLYFMNNTDHGGAALALVDLILGIKQQYPNIKPIVVTGKNNKLNKLLTEIDVENYSFPFRNFISSYHEPARLWSFLYKIRHYFGNRIAQQQLEKNIDLKDVDIIHTNLDRIDIGAILAKKYQIPHVWHIREHLDVWYGDKKLDIDNFESDFKVLTTENNFIEYMLSFPSTFVTISDSVSKSWLDKGISKNNMKKVYDGVKLPSKKENKVWFQNDKINLVFVGGYHTQKGQERFLKLFSKLPTTIQKEYTISFYGSGDRDYMSYLEQLAQNISFSSYEFNSYIDNLQEKLSLYDIGINFSSQEGFGRVTVEYLANSLCVIASKSGANTEILTNGSGFLLDKDDTQSFIDLFVFLAKNREEIKTLGQQGPNYAENFSIENHVSEIVKLYSSFINE